MLTPLGLHPRLATGIWLLWLFAKTGTKSNAPIQLTNYMEVGRAPGQWQGKAEGAGGHVGWYLCV